VLSTVGSQLTWFCTAQLDAAQVQKLTKADMQEFYNKYLDPESTDRARLSVHLHAQGASELDKKIIRLLKQVNLDDVPEGKRQSIDLLESHLKSVPQLSEDQTSEILTQAKTAGLKKALQDNESPESALLVATAIQSASEITDVTKFKASLSPVTGGRPLNPLTDFEDRETKL
jgi:insulysin